VASGCGEKYKKQNSNDEGKTKLKNQKERGGKLSGFVFSFAF